MSTFGPGFTAADLAKINARNRARLIKRGNWSAPVDPPKPSGRPKSPPKNREQIKQQYIARLAKRKAQRDVKREYKTSDGEALLIQQMQLAGITDWVREYRFHDARMWRVDFAWPKVRLAVEIEGGTFSGGRHVRGKGFAADCEKYCELTCAGWQLLRCTTEQVKAGRAIQWITDMLVGLQIGLSNSAQDAREASKTGQGALQRTGKPLPPAGEP